MTKGSTTVVDANTYAHCLPKGQTYVFALADKHAGPVGARAQVRPYTM